MTWLVIVIAGRLFASVAPSPEACFVGGDNAYAWALSNNYRVASIQCVTSPSRPKGSQDLIDWMRKGDA